MLKFEATFPHTNPYNFAITQQLPWRSKYTSLELGVAVIILICFTPIGKYAYT